MGDPLRPPVRLSAPPGHGRPAPPLREDLRPLRCRKGGLGRVTRKTKGTLREERAGRPSAERRETGGLGSPHATRRARGARSRIRRRSPARGFADAGGGSGRPANGSEAEGGPQARRRDATNSTRSRQRGALRGRSGADCLPDEASWAGLRPAADLAVAARPAGRPSRPTGGGSTVAPKRAARRQATGADVKGLCADDCRAEAQIRPKARFTQVVKASPCQDPCK